MRLSSLLFSLVAASSVPVAAAEPTAQTAHVYPTLGRIVRDDARLDALIAPDAMPR